MSPIEALVAVCVKLYAFLASPSWGPRSLLPRIVSVAWVVGGLGFMTHGVFTFEGETFWSGLVAAGLGSIALLLRRRWVGWVLLGLSLLPVVAFVAFVVLYLIFAPGGPV